MTPKYVCTDGLITYLYSPESKGVEQWLHVHEDAGFRFIKWIRIVKEQGCSSEKAEWCLYEKTSLDVGSILYIDIDEFEDVGNPDEPEGKRSVHPSPEAALRHAEMLGASPGKFVAVGGIQYIYLDFIQKCGPPDKGAREWFSPG